MLKRCMIVEDQALIAMALEMSLEEAGFEIAALFATNEKALDWLQENTPEVAVVDIMLKDGPCLELARRLKDQGVPFVVYSGPPVADEPPIRATRRALA